MQFIETYRDWAPTWTSSIVAATTLYHSVAGDKAPQCVVVATEIGEVLVLSPKNLAVLLRVGLPSTAVHLSAQGGYEVDYRILVACRNGAVYTIKNGKLQVGTQKSNIPKPNQRDERTF